MTFTPQAPSRLRHVPGLPLPPPVPLFPVDAPTDFNGAVTRLRDLSEWVESAARWMTGVDEALRLELATYADRLQHYVALSGNESGDIAFAAAQVSATVTFGRPEPDVTYTPLAIPTWSANLSYANLATTGFDVVASAAPGGAGGTVKWAVVR